MGYTIYYTFPQYLLSIKPCRFILDYLSVHHALCKAHKVS